MRGTLQTIETSRPAMGLRPVVIDGPLPRECRYDAPPRVGEIFQCEFEDAHPSERFLATGHVVGVREDGGAICFRTKRSTYRLEPAGAGSPEDITATTVR